MADGGKSSRGETQAMISIIGDDSGDFRLRVMNITSYLGVEGIGADEADVIYTAVQPYEPALSPARAP